MRTILLGTALAVAATAALADYPERRIQHIYPWSPGTPTYAVSQLIADAMGEELGVEMPVVAKPGAGGVNAFTQALNEPADGYTTIDGYVAPLVIAPMFDRADWSCEDFTPLYSATSNAFAIVSRPDEERWSDFPSFIQYLQDNPGETRYSGAAQLALPHVVMARVLQQNDAVARHVPYQDLADGLTDMRGGILDWMVANPGMYRANKDNMRVLAVLSELPEVVEIYDGAQRVEDYGVDLGMSGLAPMGWNWWLVKQGTPEDVVARLREAMGAALARPDVRERIIDIGFVPTEMAPEEYAETCASVEEQLRGAMDAVTWEEEQVQALQ